MPDAENSVIGTIGKGRSSEVRVSLGVVHGARVVDLRTFSSWTDDGELRPTKRGVCLQIGQLRALRALLDRAEAEANRMGWQMGEGGA